MMRELSTVGVNNYIAAVRTMLNGEIGRIAPKQRERGYTAFLAKDDKCIKSSAQRAHNARTRGLVRVCEGGRYFRRTYPFLRPSGEVLKGFVVRK